MITEQDLQAAIAECVGTRNPTSSTCIKLAAFYTIRNELFGKDEQLKEPMYSFAAPPVNEDTITYQSDTEFSQTIYNRRSDEVWPVIDELMQTIAVLNPRLYASVMRKLQ